MNRKLTVSLVVALAIIIVGFGIYKFLANQKKLPQSKETPEIARYVKIDIVKYNTIQANINSKGRVVPWNTVELVAEGAGKMEDKTGTLEVGFKFKKGETLISIYKDEVELALKARKSNLQRLVANLLPDIRLDYNDHFQAFEAFFNAIDVNKNLPEFPEINSDKFKLFLASKGLLADYYSALKDEKAVGRYTVGAPFAGSVSAVYMDQGTYANIGSRIAQLIQTDTVEVEIPVDATGAKFINIGDKVHLAGELEGEVISKAAFVDEATQSQLIYVSYKNSGLPQLLPGEYISARFYGQEIESVMEIPRNAVFNFNEVFTIKNGRLVNNEIEIVKQNDKTLYYRGIAEGDTIVVQPLIGVSNGSKVKPILN